MPDSLRTAFLRPILALLALLTASLVAPFASAATTHVVAPGHTLAKIAHRYNVTVEALRGANNLRPGERLRPGQRIVIPDDSSASSTPATSARSATSKPATTEAPSTTHRIAAGQTLGRIAQRYRASADAIREANHLSPGERLQPGLCLLIPLAFDERPVPAAARPCTPGAPGPQASARSPHPKNYVSRPLRPGVLHIIRGAASWTGRLLDRRGHVLPDGQKHLDRLLASDASGEARGIDARLFPLLAQTSDHFGGRTIQVVSGFRPASTNRYSTRSHHNVGEAVDFSLDGVPNDVLRDYLHTLSRVGVGFYPNSTFVHLDVRSVTTHWVDESGPGEAPRYSSVVAPEARTATASRPPPARPHPPRAVPAPPVSSPDDPETTPDTE